MDGQHTTAQLRAIAASARFYKLDRLLRRRRDVRMKDFEALRTAARKVVRTEAEAPELGRDMNPYLMMVRSELEQSV